MSASEAERRKPLQRANLPPELWSESTPTGFSHCDPARIVFKPRYFDILTEVVERFSLSACGSTSKRRHGLGYGRVSCDFFDPNRMCHELEVVTLPHIGRPSYDLVPPTFRYGCEVLRGRTVTVTTSLTG